MLLMTALRRLWLRRAPLIAAIAFACLVGFAISLSSHQYQVGIASASALVDTPKSQVADVGADTGSDVLTLAARASLLGSIMANSPIKDDIARLAGVQDGRLIATQPITVGAPASPAPSVPNASIRQSSPLANLLDVSIVQGGQLPIIEVDTQAPTAARAARLANESFVALQADVSSVAAADHIPALDQVIIRPLGAAGFATSTRGTGPLFAFIGGLLALLLACAAILALPSIAAAWRRASAMEGVAPGNTEEHDRLDIAVSSRSAAASPKHDGVAAGQHADTAERHLRTAQRRTERT